MKGAKGLADIPVHRLNNLDFYASHSEGVNFGEFAPSHRIDFFAIVWFRSDRDTHFIDFEPYPIRKNLVYLLARNQVHALPGSPPKANVILFSREFFDRIEEDEFRFLFLPFYNDPIRITEQALEPLSTLFDLILLENTGVNDLRLIHFYMKSFLLILHRINSSSSKLSAFHDERLRKLFNLVSANFRRQKFADFYADRIGITSKRLNQIVKEKFGITVSQLIYNFTLIEAKREISHSTKSLKIIAIELGFKEQSYFSRFFKKQTSLSPEEFRRRYR